MDITLDQVAGDGTGLAIPAHGDALQRMGADFLTEAFRSFGTIGRDNRVAAVRRFERCLGGSTGEKFFLAVAYEHDEADLDEELFVKFSRDFSDVVRDQRGKYELEGEVRLAGLCRDRNFPVAVPKPYFADYQAETHVGLLITERIPFGKAPVEPQHHKCMDHLLREPVEHYRTIVRSLACIAAAHRSGRLGSDIDHRFPYDPVEAAQALRIGTDERRLREQIATFAAFFERSPQLFPAAADVPGVLATLDRHAGRIHAQQHRIAEFLTSSRDLVALCHWNANIDNCWFWRGDAGELHCGLMDWGNAGQLNVAFSLWGCLSGADPSVWHNHADELIALFLDDLASGGGPVVDPSELRLHLDLYALLMGLSYFMESPSRILYRAPKAESASGPLDPIILDNDTARNQLLISTNFLNLVKRHDPGEMMDHLAAA